MLAWTEAEFESLGAQALGPTFLFSAFDPELIEPGSYARVQHQTELERASDAAAQHIMQARAPNLLP
jgi:hypothetical protein